ncbi:MAG: hypothetical protein A2Y79_11160 [Deltaproteobacteria bacterium RBG_13_43_22]|jgi:hypothetical protein|nr:MAG: hypothetical protein A2Y79_11160 [Deltaproteobacteria bacterium RBG_13_43_22]
MLKLEKLEQDREFKDQMPVFNVYRSKIPGGWLVFMYNLEYEKDTTLQLAYGWGYGGVTFVPDPEHKWDGSSLP